MARMAITYTRGVATWFSNLFVSFPSPSHFFIHFSHSCTLLVYRCATFRRSPTHKMSPLAKVKENFLFNANRGWFLPDSEPDTGLFSVGERGGPLGYREAAVLCLLSYHQGQVQILLTKRSSGISFQGTLLSITLAFTASSSSYLAPLIPTALGV